jgi:hypothetical protein
MASEDSAAGRIDTDTKGVVLEPSLTEVTAVFAGNAAIEDAIFRLTESGFDRADISLLTDAPAASGATPETSEAPLFKDDDRQQARTLGTSMAAATVAIGAAGITVATGGAAAAVIAAAVIGGGAAGAVANAVAQGSEGLVQANREMAGEAGALRLSVRVANPVKRALAEAALREAGGRDVTLQTR